MVLPTRVVFDFTLLAYTGSESTVYDSGKHALQK